MHLYFSFTDKKISGQLKTENEQYLNEKIKKEEFTGKETETLSIEFLKEGTLQRITLIGLGRSTKLTARVLKDRVGEVIRGLHTSKTDTVVIHANDGIKAVEDNSEAIGEGIILGDYVFEDFKAEESRKKINHVKNAYLLVSESNAIRAKKKVESAEKKSVAVLFARNMINTPASHLHPGTLVEKAQEIGKLSKGRVKVEVLDKKMCEKLGMGAFLGVAEGSERQPAFIVLRYEGKGSKKIALIGKSITFDSGGLSLKPSEAMMDMKIDMSGGAAVLGVFHYLATENPTVSFGEVFGILPACENMPSGKAIKPGDIVRAMNGKTIEVLNTDAEGRLTLADGLVYAEEQLKADYCFDLATLTGACMVALGNDLAGLFTNDEQFEKEYNKYATEAGDEYWRLPLYEGYAKQMKSDIADLKNIGGGRYGGAITAGLFLKAFVKKMKWIHIDIAGPAYRESEKGMLPKGASGWGVASIINFLEQFSAL